MKVEKAITSFIKSDDPLSANAIEFLISYREEDCCLDYKEDFHPEEDREWLGITKDIIAFANTLGGYLVFGVKDKTHELTNIEAETLKTLSDSNLIMQKVNRFIEPPITYLRSKKYKKDGKNLAIVFIPQSVDRTHVISKDGMFSYSGGNKTTTILREGTFYVRGSASNHLGTSRDIDEIVQRRNALYRESLLANIARVVEAPAESEVVILSTDPNSGAHKKFIIEDGPDSIPVKGLGFATAPRTPEEEVAAFNALISRDINSLPPRAMVWKWYSDREKLKLSKKQKLGIAKLSIFCEVPALYWVRGIKADKIKEMLTGAIRRRPSGTSMEPLFQMALFLGKGFYNSLLKSINRQINKLPPKMRKYPLGGPTSVAYHSIISSRQSKKERLTEADFRKRLLRELDGIAESVDKSGKEQPGVMERRAAMAIDCYLYAQNDKYV